MQEDLIEPIYLLSEQSEYYQSLKRVKDSQGTIQAIVENIAYLVGFDPKHFAFYNKDNFGFYTDTASKDKFDKMLRRVPDAQGLHTFKRSAKLFDSIRDRLSPIDEIHDTVDYFDQHLIFGINNATRAEWVGDDYFVNVANPQALADLMAAREHPSIKEYVIPVDYEVYLAKKREQEALNV